MIQSDKSKNFDPDYGLHILSSGWSKSAPIYLLNCSLDHISILEEGKYRATMGRTTSGKKFAITYDFGEDVLQEIMKIVPEHIRRLINKGIEGQKNDPPNIFTVEFNELVPISGFAAHLGSVERAEREDFVPLIVERLISREDLPM